MLKKLVLLSSIVAVIESSSVNIVIQLDNVTNTVDRYVFGVNTNGNNLNYTATNYTIVRNGGEAMSRFNWEIDALNSAKDWYFISQKQKLTWQTKMDPVVNAGADVFMVCNKI